MSTRFLDTNVFIRYLTGDDPAKAARCQTLFVRLSEGREEATTSEAIVSEIVYVLASRRLAYRASRQQILDGLRPLLLMKGLRLRDRWRYVRALELYASAPLDFEDALAVIHTQEDSLAAIVSYDHGFDAIPGVVRNEP